jgi:predicted DsbA family dithiol-disulfide isomerase
MNQLKIDVWSDVVCPFCYLGKRKLEKAIQKLNIDDQVVVEWHSFQLDPSFPKNIGVPATQHLVKRKGIALSSIQSAQSRLADQGKNYNIDFQFERAINFNTENAHRLLHWAKTFGKAGVLKEALFKAHFSDGIDLSKPENIVQVVSSVGLDGDSVATVLNGDDYSIEFLKDVSMARQLGISGVPFFVFNMKTAISGAQPDNVFEEVLTELVKAQESQIIFIRTDSSF